MTTKTPSIPLSPASFVFPNPSSSNYTPASVGPAAAARLHRLYRTQLRENEIPWRDRYTFFLKKGLELRPRYRPDWSPSWLGTTLDPSDCEDSIEQILPMVLDAKRTNDGVFVCIKRIQQKPQEVDIGRYLSSEEPQNPNNHTVPIWDSFRDPISPGVEYIIMPILRPYDDPDFGAVGEVVDFITQILEGMDFMHSHLIAHGDLTGANLMMDGRSILPQGWHFCADNCAPNGVELLNPRSRLHHPVRYFIIDFDYSVRFRPGESQLIEGFGGRDGDVPELAHHQPYDPFKLDVYTAGNVFYKEFYKKYLDLEFLSPLLDIMLTHDFHKRPTAQFVLQHWCHTKDSLPLYNFHWRLRRRSESVGERVVLDTVAAARQGIHSVKRLFNGEESNPRINA